MSYVLRCTDLRPSNGYVQPPGQEHSHGPKETAQRYSTREAALAEKCENEVIEADDDNP